MGCAPMGHILHDELMKYNPKNPYWFNRDRFVLSAGHGCILQHALLHLALYDNVKIQIPDVVDWLDLQFGQMVFSCALYQMLRCGGSYIYSSCFYRWCHLQQTKYLVVIEDAKH